MVGLGFANLVRRRAVVAGRERARTLWLRAQARLGDPDPCTGFFDSHPRFYSTSTTFAIPNRLNQRYRALIQANEAIIRGRAVLDIASHDGRWSLAACEAGAQFVLGIEARPRLVESARANLRAYGIPGERFRFVEGDALEEVRRLEPGTFDTVFCFGFLYHTLHHMWLLSAIARLKPRHVIIDTEIDPDPLAVIRVRRDGIASEDTNAVPDVADPSGSLIGCPSKSALEAMLSSCGLTPAYYNWRRAGVKSWAGLEDYYLGRRVSLVGTSFSRERAEPNQRRRGPRAAESPSLGAD
jgi:precorrin-6B methylase 2